MKAVLASYSPIRLAASFVVLAALIYFLLGWIASRWNGSLPSDWRSALAAAVVVFGVGYVIVITIAIGRHLATSGLEAVWTENGQLFWAPFGRSESIAAVVSAEAYRSARRPWESGIRIKLAGGTSRDIATTLFAGGAGRLLPLIGKLRPGLPVVDDGLE